jgi:hypothetical protein
MKHASSHSGANTITGKLRIGDHWNAITIIALSQSNPLKAVAEFVENSIDAHARNNTLSAAAGERVGVRGVRGPFLFAQKAMATIQ